VKSATPTRTASGHRIRLLMQCGTALPLLALAVPALAAPIQETSAGDIEIDAVDASGTPEAVQAESTGGSITASVGTVTSTAGQGVRGAVVELETDTDGAIAGDFGSITGTGQGELLALHSESAAGDIALTVGTIDVDGSATAGIAAHSGSGAVSISADSVIARGTGMDSGGEFYEAVQGVSDTGPVTINVGSAETYGQYGSAIGAIAGGDIDITADSATIHSDQTIVVYANASGDGDVTLDLGSATSTAADGQGVYVTTETGDASVAVDTITLGTEAEAARILAGGDIDLTVGDADAGGGVTARSTNGDANVVVTGDIVGRTYGGLEATGKNVTVTMEQGSSITAAGDTWNGIFASGTDSVSVVATDVDTVGQSIRAASTNGSASVAVDGDVTSHTYNAISISSEGADVTIADGSTITSGGGSAAIAIGGHGGDVTIDNGGTIMVQGSGESAIGTTTGGDINITSNAITVASDVAPSGTFNSGGINADSNGGGNVSVASNTIDVSGPGRFGIAVSAIGDGTVTVDATDTVLDSAEHSGINATSEAGDIAITGGSIETMAAGSGGVYASSTDGDVSIAFDSALTHGDDSNDYYSEALFAQSANGTASVTAGSSTAEGFAASAAVALGGAGANVTVDEASVGGQFSAALYAQSNNGDAVVNAGTVTLLGDQQAAANAFAATGKAIVSVDSIDSQGTLGQGIYAQGAGGVEIESGTISVQKSGIYGEGLSQTTAMLSDVSIVTTGDTVSEESYAIGAKGANVAITTGADTLTSGTTGITADGSQSVTIVNGGTTSASGGLGSAIIATSAGSMSVVSDTVTVTGAGTDPGVRDDGSNYRVEQGGIILEQTSGTADAPITVDAGTVTVAGDHRYGISVRGNSDITIDADDVTLASADSVAVVARGGEGDVSITTGTVTTTGASGVGVFGNTTSGDITIAAGTTRVENEGLAGDYTGDAVTGISDSGHVAVSSEDAFTAALYGSAVVGVGGSVEIASGKAETTGDGGVAVYAYASNGDAAASVDDVSTSGADTQAVTVRSNTNIATLTLGNMTTTGANGAGAFVEGANMAQVVVDGDVQTSGYAVSAGTMNGAAVVTVNGSIDAGATGVKLNGPIGVLVNNGSISSAEGPAVLSLAGYSEILNNGILDGVDGIALQTGAGDDKLTLTENSDVTGLIDLGDGDDVLELGFADMLSDDVGQVAGTTNVESLSVLNGQWLAEGPASAYDSVSIAQDAALTVAWTNGDAAIETGNVLVDGTLNLQLDVDSEAGDFSDIVIAGAGSVHLTGDATVLFDDTSGMQYEGGTFVENGELLLTDEFGGDITTSGDGTFTLAEGGDFTGNLENNGHFVFDQAGDYSFLGDFSGTGSFDKNGDGTLTFAGLYDFGGTTTVNGGTVSFTGDLDEDTELDLSGGGTVDLSQNASGSQTVAQLSGSGGSLNLGQTNLVIEQEEDTVFAGEIEGTGGFDKSGSGNLVLAGTSTFSGTASVNSGTLSVNGSLANATVVVNSGGKLGGNGTVGQTQVGAGGALGAGNSIGHLTIAGDLTLTAGSTLIVEVDATGANDKVDVTGTATLGGAAMEVLAEDGVYAPFTDYTVLTAEDGIVGTFGSVTTDLAFLVPTLDYGANAVTLTLTRNDINFSAYGTTPNQRAVGGLIEALGFGSALYDETLTLATEDVAADFATLTGEVYPAHGAALIETADMLRRQIAPEMAGAQAEGAFIWGAGLGGWIKGEGRGGVGQVKVDNAGLAAGIGYGFGDFSVALGGGAVSQDPQTTQLHNADITFLGGQVTYGGVGAGSGLSAHAGVQFGWSDASVSRQSSLGTIGDSLSGKLDGNFTEIYGEAAYGVPFGEGLSIAPYVGVSHVSLDFDDVAETGGVTALTVSGLDRDVTFADIGARIESSGEGFNGHVATAWRQAWGDRASNALVGFAGSPNGALISSLPIAKGAARLEAGLSYTAGPITVGVDYDGTFSNSFDSHGLKGALSVRF